MGKWSAWFLVYWVRMIGPKKSMDENALAIFPMSRKWSILSQRSRDLLRTGIHFVPSLNQRP